MKKIREYIKDKNEKIFIYWEDSGLLSGLSKSDSEALALKLNEVAKILINGNSFIRRNGEYLIYPIIRRAFSKNHLIVNCLRVIQHVNNRIYALDDIECFDVEAEFCELMAEEISNLKL